MVRGTRCKITANRFCIPWRGYICRIVGRYKTQSYKYIVQIEGENVWTTIPEVYLTELPS